jgi:hypothetical protein
VSHWIKPIGTGQRNLPADWLAQRPGVLERTGFSRRPQVADGDRFVFYASGWRCIFAIVEGVGEPQETRPGQRWPWTMAVEPLLVKRPRFLAVASSREEAAVTAARRRWRRSASPRARSASIPTSAWRRRDIGARWM